MTADDITISLGLPSFRVTQQRVEPERYDIWVEPTVPGAVCPRCGQPSTAYHDSYERTVRDLPILGRPVYLHMLQRSFFRACLEFTSYLAIVMAYLVSNFFKLFSLSIRDLFSP